jgi:hypothetical protein
MIVLVAQWLAVDEAALHLLTNTEIHELLRSRPDTHATHLATYTPDGDEPFTATEELWEFSGDPDLSVLPRWHGAV